MTTSFEDDDEGPEIIDLQPTLAVQTSKNVSAVKMQNSISFKKLHLHTYLYISLKYVHTLAMQIKLQITAYEVLKLMHPGGIRTDVLLFLKIQFQFGGRRNRIFYCRILSKWLKVNLIRLLSKGLVSNHLLTIKFLPSLRKKVFLVSRKVWKQFINQEY
jgi:hypothetical protein